MPITPTYPGVYVEEIPSGVRTITGVSTSVTAFIGYAPAGPANDAKQVFNFGEYERHFGGLHKDSPMSYGVSQFFLNGGGEAWIVRVAQGAATASVTMQNPEPAKDNVLTIAAKSAGKWGNYLRLDVDYDTTNPNATFNLNVTEFVTRGQDLVPDRVERFQNLSMNSKSPFYVENVVEATSQLIKATRHATVAGLIAGLPAGTSASGTITLPADLNNTTGSNIVVSVDGGSPATVPAFDRTNPLPATVEALKNSIVNAINAELGAGTVTGSAVGGVITLTSTSSGDEESAVVISNASSGDIAAALHLGVANGGTEIPATESLRPAQTGTVGLDLAGFDPTNLNSKNMNVKVTFDTGAGDETKVINFGTEFTANSTASDVARKLQEKIRALDPAKSIYAQAEVEVVNGAIRVVMGGDSPNTDVEFDNPGGLATAMRIRTGQSIGGSEVNENVTRYALGLGEVKKNQIAPSQGADGTKGGVTELIGNASAKTGIYALEDVDTFNILCIPESAGLSDAQAKTLIGKAAAYVEERRAFYIVDPPDVGAGTPDDIKDWYADLGLQSKNSAIYFPRIKLSDPLENYRVGPFAPSGTMAGLYARTDSSRGVWKAPAGTEAGLRVAGLDVQMTDDQNGVLNKLGINALRTFPVYGRVSWGARTFEGADQKASEWKYVPVRRTALYIEESLFRGLKWAVFEPNDEGLWAQIRVAAGGFMHNLFRQSAFQGTSPRDAYFVKCDGETTTQNDIDLGIVNVLVGFAPLKPAEFVILKIQQIAGQVQT